MKHPNRRDTLKFGLAGALLPSVARAQSDGSEQVDAIVIGAGIAGLAAAKELTAQGMQIVVLEASNRIGGRIHTDRSLGLPVEVGAGWIHGPRGNPISDLVRQAELETFVTDDESFQLFTADGSSIEDDTVEDSIEQLQAAAEIIDEELDDDTALEVALRRYAPSVLDDPLTRWMLSAYTEFSTGGPLADLSASYFDEDETFGGADVIIPDGYDLVLAPLARALDVRFAHSVNRITHSGNAVQVTTSQGEFTARAAICTVPLGVLKSGCLTFDPPLPSAYRQSIDRIGMGQVTKLALRFEQPFWPTDSQYFGAITQPPGRWNYMLNTLTHAPVPMLMAVSLGAYARTVEAMDERDALEDAMQVLRGMFGAGIPDLTGHLMSRWSRDPLALGAYSYAKLGSTPDDFDRFGEPVGALHFAGEHTDFAYHGTVHGAYLSGLRAAEAILEQQ